MLWAKIRYEEFRASKYVKFDFTKNIFTLWSWYSHILRKYNINMIIIMGTKFIVLSSVEYVMSQNLKRTIVRKIKVRKKNFSNFSVNPKTFTRCLFPCFQNSKRCSCWKINLWSGTKDLGSQKLMSLELPKIFFELFEVIENFYWFHCWNQVLLKECHMRNEKL